MRKRPPRDPSRPVHVVHVVPSLEPGGLENGVVNIIQHADPNEVRHAVVCLERAGRFADRLPEDVPIHVIGKTRGNDPRCVVSVARFARRFDADIVHTRNWASLVEGSLAAWLVGARVVHGIHGRTKKELDGVTRRRELVEGMLIRKLADKVVALLPNLVHEVERFGIGASRIAVIENGVDLDRFKPDPEARARIRKALGFDGKTIVVGCVARLDPVKDHATLFKAFAKLQKSARLVLVGDGPLRPPLEQLATVDGLAERVTFLGHREDLGALYSAFDIFALASHYEASSNTILEAMASGLPVVATRVGGNEGHVTADTGILVDPGDFESMHGALARFAQDPNGRRAMGRAARERAEMRSLPRMARSYEAIYRELASRPLAPSWTWRLLTRVRALLTPKRLRRRLRRLEAELELPALEAASSVAPVTLPVSSPRPAIQVNP